MPRKKQTQKGGDLFDDAESIVKKVVKRGKPVYDVVKKTVRGGKLPKRGKVIIIHTHGKGRHRVSVHKASDIHKKGGSVLSTIATGLGAAGTAADLTGAGAVAGVPMQLAGTVLGGIDSLGEGLGLW